MKILIVDDSIVVRRSLRELFLEKPEIEVIAEACNANEAVYFAGKFNPDIITMDINMPGGSGFTAIDKIMKEYPTPILILTSSIEINGNASIFQLMKYGIIDVFEKPDITEWEKNSLLRETFFNKLNELYFAGKKLKRTKRTITFNPKTIKIVGIVSSTGGPKVLKEIFSNLESSIRVPIICVQHISAGFGPGLVKWLNINSKLPIKTAEHNEKLKSGIIYFAPDDHHIEINASKRISLNKKEPVFGLRPLGDYLLKSLSLQKEEACGIILTGMGGDGTDGFREMHIAGGYTIAQNKESSVVWGMPKSAIDANVVVEVLDISGMIGRLNELI